MQRYLNEKGHLLEWLIFLTTSLALYFKSKSYLLYCYIMLSQRRNETLWLLLTLKSLTIDRSPKVTTHLTRPISSLSKIATPTMQSTSTKFFNIIMSMCTNCGPANQPKDSSSMYNFLKWSLCKGRKCCSKKDKPHLWSGIVKKAIVFSSKANKMEMLVWWSWSSK